MDVGFVIEVLSWALIGIGSFLIVVAAIGLLRMPDIYTRMHAAGMTETAGAATLLFGLMLQAGFTINAFKLFALAVLFFFTSPVATHALARAALYAGLKPLCARDAEEANDLISSGAITIDVLHDDGRRRSGSSGGASSSS